MPLNLFLNNSNGIAQPSPAGIMPVLGPYATPFTRTDISYDYAIGGIPFLAGEGGRGTYFRRIYTRSFSPIRKDQFDNQQVPGEQSIWGWWLRSQSNFDLGAGVQFLDTTTDQTLGERFFYSEGLDMLTTPGQVSLLPQCIPSAGLAGTGPIKLRSGNVSATNGVFALDIGAATLKFMSDTGTIINFTMPGGLTGLANTFTDDGSFYYFADKTGIYKGDMALSGTPASKIWNPPGSGTNAAVLGWIKGRLVAGWDNSVYELVGAGPALPTPKFTHQNARYTFTDVSELQSAILVSGNAGVGLSQIHKFTLDSGGAMPTLTSGIVDVTMPIGEQILSMYAYIGAYVGIGTNKGFRVALADINGNLTYGPLIVQDPSGVGVQAISGYDRFMFIGNQGNKLIPQQGWVNPSDASNTDGIVRVDLGQQTSTGGQPYANDLMAWDTINQTYLSPTGSPVNSIANVIPTGSFNGFSPMIAFATGGAVYWSGNRFAQLVVKSGSFYTPKIRFNTLEPKHFKYVYLRHPNITSGTIDIYGRNPESSVELIAQGISGPSSDGATTPFFIADIGNAQEWFQFKFVLNAANSSSTTGPVLNGYQLRGLPGVTRQVLIEIPLLCFDNEKDKFSVDDGYDGAAYARIKALEALTASGNIVLFQDLNYNDTNLVIVDDYHFEQQSPELAKAASGNNQDSNAHGGYIILTCRVVQ